MALIEFNTKGHLQAVSKLREDLRATEETTELFQERIAELELALEDRDWTKLMGEADTEFSKKGLDKINWMARLYWLKNPLIRRAVITQTQYVFGQGVEVEAEDERVNKVISKFWDDRENQDELTSQQALATKETELQLFGNIFFVLFVKPLTGRIKLRTIPMSEITEIIKDPDDRNKVLFYKREFTKGDEQKVLYYPDWNNASPGTRYEKKEVTKEKVFHLSVNKLSDMSYGVSEVYSALDWARAYKDFLEDWATVVASYAKFAWKVTTKGGKRGVSNVKSKLGSTIPSEGRERNPAGAAGGIFASTEGADLQPIKSSGPSVSAADGDKMIHMISAGTGIFFHYLTGDPSTGNLATAKAMERPMEIMFKDRQQLWCDTFARIFEYAIHQAAIAVKGAISGKMQTDDDGDKELILETNEETGEPMSQTVHVTFPDLLEKDIAIRVEAIAKAATLGGQGFAGILEPEVITRMLLAALNVDNADEIMDRMYPEDEEPDPNEPPRPEARRRSVNDLFSQSIKELTEAIKKMENERAPKAD